MLVVWTVVTASFVILFNLLADVLYGVARPAGAAGVIPQSEVERPRRPEVAGRGRARARRRGGLFVRRFFRHKPAVDLAGRADPADHRRASALAGCAPYDKNHQDLLLGPTPPSGEHWFGTDELGATSSPRSCSPARSR